MKLPRKDFYRRPWIIGDSGIPWKVLYKKNLKLGKHSCDGVCDPSENILWMDQKLKNSELFKTFLHELHHAFEDEYDFHLDHRQIAKLEQAWLDFWLRNF